MFNLGSLSRLSIFRHNCLERHNVIAESFSIFLFTHPINRPIVYSSHRIIMPLAFGPDIVEGRVYRGKRRQDDDDEKQAIKELQIILANKNRRSCDCEAQEHDLLENCLTCGRLACISEGPGKCFFCGNIVLNEEQRARIGKHLEISQATQIPASTTNKSQNHISRMRIIDHQFDRSSIDNKKHLKEEDRRKLRENFEELQAKRYQRKYMLDVDVDNLEAGTRSAPVVDDYRIELQRLQLSHQPDAGTSAYKLADLVQQESKNKYILEYVSTSEAKKQILNMEKAAAKVNSNQQKSKQKPQFKSLPPTQQRVARGKSDKNSSRPNAWRDQNTTDKNSKH